MSDYVSDDLISEIFERLPVKSLLLFRSLSKSWSSHILSPDFINRHALRSRKKAPKILIRHLYCEEYSDMYTIHSEDRFLSSNPESLDVSIPAVKVPNSMGDRLIVGFGFDPSIDDYKIVRISHKRSFVYTLKTRFWRPIASPTTEVRGRQEFCTCFFNGALHWVVSTGEYYTRSQYILTFHLTTHVFGKIFLPSPNWLRRELTIIDGSLALIQDKDDRIWILKEYNNVPLWSDAYKFGQFGLKFHPYTEGRSALQLTTNGHILLYFTHERNPGRMYGVYNPGTGTWDPSMIMHFQDSPCMHIETYVESLVLLDTKLRKKTMNKMKKKNKRNEIAHNVTLRKSKMPKYFY